MKRLLYIGNYFEFSAMESLGKRLEPHYAVVYASSGKNKLIRLLDMCLTVLWRRQRTDAVIIDTYSTLNFWYAWAIALLCRMSRLPYFPFLHGGNLPERLIRTPQASRVIFAHAARNIAPSGYLKGAFEQRGFSTILIPNAIDLENYPFIERTVLRPRLLWVRSFENTYHPEMAVAVLAKLIQTYPEAQLCMVGAEQDGSLANCRRLAQTLQVTSRIVFTGKLPKPEWTLLATGYDIFLNTTNLDNTPVSVLEAMALGLPVVSTNAGGMPFLIDHRSDGLLSPVQDMAAMVENIHLLIETPGLAAKISRQARHKVAQFDWKIVEQQWLDLLQ